MLNRILLIGDSIRMAYFPLVQENLQQKAVIYNIKENCEDSKKVKRKLKKWIAETGPEDLSIIHFNCGLHDIKRKFGSKKNKRSLAQYEANLKKIIQILKETTSAQLIWASITPVIYHRHHEKKGFDRFESDVERYNCIAQGIVQKEAIPINNLFSIIQEEGIDDCICDDGVHMTEKGNILLAEAVTTQLSKYIAKQSEEFKE